MYVYVGVIQFLRMYLVFHTILSAVYSLFSFVFRLRRCYGLNVISSYKMEVIEDIESWNSHAGTA